MYNCFNMDFSNKVVLITGASSGIGESLAILLSGYSAKLALVGRDVNNLNKVAKTCENSKGIKPLTILAELAKETDVERIARDTINHFGRLDVLVNNAAFGLRANLENLDLKVYDDLMNVNTRAVVQLTKLLLPYLVKSQGNIVNVSSLASTVAMPFNLAYSMTKAALDHFTRILSVDLGPKGVRVNSVNPGLTLTNFSVRAGFTKEQYNNFVEACKQTIALRRPVESAEVANLIGYLASDLARSITGQTIIIDGGHGLSSFSHLTSKL